jgi:hypothetical protein
MTRGAGFQCNRCALLELVPDVAECSPPAGWAEVVHTGNAVDLVLHLCPRCTARAIELEGASS